MSDEKIRGERQIIVQSCAEILAKTDSGSRIVLFDLRRPVEGAPVQSQWRRS